MNEAGQGEPAPAAVEEVLPQVQQADRPTIKALLGEMSLLEWIQSVRLGLSMPKNSGEYRYATQQLQHLWSPVCGVFLPLLLVLLMLATPEQGVVDKDAIPVTIEATKDNDVLKDDPKNKDDPAPVEPPPPDDPNIRPEIGDPTTSMAGPSSPVGPSAGPSSPFSPKPAAFDSVAIVKSPLTMKGVYASRSPGARGTLTGGGGGGGVGGGDRNTEEAVIRALRWLKKNQSATGAWGKSQHAMTGLAILTFLAHGERPGDSAEFGPTIQKALEFLLKSQRPDGRISASYSHAIATYALCEAYGMTMNPNVKAAAEKALAVIIKGQTPEGGWCYGLVSTDDNDTSVMGWCAQALKAGKMANLQIDGIEKASKLAINGFKKNAGPAGGFGYRTPGATGLTSVGTLCMQLLGASNEKQVKMSLDIMDAWSPSFEEKQAGVGGGNLQYYFYYATQCKFHVGGARWTAWNSMMKKIYVPAQKVTLKASSGYVDHKGNPQDIGWWENKDAHGDRPTMDTCLAALQLMVYYRYLPTTSKEALHVEEEIAPKTTDTTDIKVNIGNL